MDRITARDSKGVAIIPVLRGKKGQRIDLGEPARRFHAAISRLADYEDTGWTPEDISEKKAMLAERFVRLMSQELGMTQECLRDIVAAHLGGRLVVLPCKVGDHVFVRSEDGGIYTARVQGISISATGTDTILHFGGYPVVNAWGSGKGKTWFLTRQEVEAALKKEAAKHGPAQV